MQFYLEIKTRDPSIYTIDNHKQNEDSIRPYRVKQTIVEQGTYSTIKRLH